VNLWTIGAGVILRCLRCNGSTKSDDQQHPSRIGTWTVWGSFGEGGPVRVVVSQLFVSHVSRLFPAVVIA
jgi:hypothetical protein